MGLYERGSNCVSQRTLGNTAAWCISFSNLLTPESAGFSSAVLRQLGSRRAIFVDNGEREVCVCVEGGGGGKVQGTSDTITVCYLEAYHRTARAHACARTLTPVAVHYPIPRHLQEPACRCGFQRCNHPKLIWFEVPRVLNLDYQRAPMAIRARTT